MLPSAARIRRRPEFTSVLRGGTRAARGGVVVHWSGPATTNIPGYEPHNVSQPPLSESDSARAGFVVSKAVGNAVMRNKVKRRLRHIVRDHIDHWPSGTEVVVRATPRSSERSFQQLSEDLVSAADAARRKSERQRHASPRVPSPSGRSSES